MNQDAIRTHSPHIRPRDTLDGGFSKGWGMHFLPSEEYWVDMHNHLSGISDVRQIRHLMDQWFARLDAYRLGQSVMIVEGSELFDVFEEYARSDSRFAWMYWPTLEAPELALVERAVKKGAVGLKLHNHSLMRGEVPREIYQSPQWQRVFAFAQEARLPLLWHVTQRTGYSPYHGGGENAYWAEGWGRGVTFTNEDLLNDLRALLDRYPRMPVIGAHQLHVGLERLQELLDAHENLLIDSSCGFYLRWADDFIEEDRLILKAFLERYATRVLYGTDSGLAPGGIDDYLVMGALCHARFLLRLGLSNEALQRISHENAARIFHLPACPSARRGNVRP